MKRNNQSLQGAVENFQKKILSWYQKNQRDLPWRKTRDPYKILVSEVMLQQTQVSRVIPKYEAWLERFPTVYELARATIAEVLQYWSGLGYNKRALYLQRLAKVLVERKEEKDVGFTIKDKRIHREDFFPRTEEELMKLPGIGKYTARALLCFAFDKQVAVVDTNVKKVILTEVLDSKNFLENKEIPTPSLRDTPPPEGIWNGGGRGWVSVKNVMQIGDRSKTDFQLTENDIEKIADQLLPYGKAYEWNQALMDYSSLMLKKSKIKIPKQSKFKDSDRYYRGAIIRFLIKQPVLSFTEIQEMFGQDKKIINNLRLEKILRGLEKDGLIIQKQQEFSLS